MIPTIMVHTSRLDNSQHLEIVFPKSLTRWLGRLGRCVGASDHASFCFPCGVYSSYVLGISLLHYNSIYIDMIIMRLWCVVIIPSHLLSVSYACIDPVGSHAPHQMVFELELSSPPCSSLLWGAPCRPIGPGLAEVWPAPRRSTHRTVKSDASYRSPTRGVQRTVRAGHWTAPMMMQDDDDHPRWSSGQWAPNAAMQFTAQMTRLLEHQLQRCNAVMAANAGHLKWWVQPMSGKSPRTRFLVHVMNPHAQVDCCIVPKRSEAFGKPGHMRICNKLQKNK